MKKKMPFHRLELITPKVYGTVVRIDQEALTYYDEDFEHTATHLDAWTDKRLRDFMNLTNSTGFICYDEDDEPVGYMLYELKKNYFSVTAFCVRPNYRRQGYGSCMLAKLYQKVNSSDVRSNIIVYVRESFTPTLNFWKAAGFKSKLIKGYYESPAEDAVRFSMAPISPEAAKRSI